MSRTFMGYVEVWEQGRWSLVFTTDTFFAGGNDHAMARLFGAQDHTAALVGERGIPADASLPLREYYEHFADDEYMKDDIVHPSWLLHSEWRSHADEILAFHRGWRTLYMMMEALAEFFGAEHVRFVAWQLI